MKKLALAALISIGCQAFAAPKVVASIKPLHSLVAQVMENVAEPELLIKQGSPHSYQMKPTDAQHIAEAELVVYVSHELETFLPPLLEKSKKAHRIEWAALPNLYPLPTRHGGMWEEGEDDEHGHDHGDKHDHHHYGHHHGTYDAHLWLSVDRSKLLLQHIAKELGKIDPAAAKTYEANAENAIARLNTQKKALAEKLKPVQTRPFMVFHDAYQYFERDYGLNAVGTVRVDPEHEPGAKRIGALHHLIQENKIVCLFSEPQFPAKIVNKLAEGGKVKTAVLDPVGADLAPGVAMYGQLLDNLADNLSGCLKPQS